MLFGGVSFHIRNFFFFFCGSSNGGKSLFPLWEMENEEPKHLTISQTSPGKNSQAIIHGDTVTEKATRPLKENGQKKKKKAPTKTPTPSIVGGGCRSFARIWVCDPASRLLEPK